MTFTTHSPEETTRFGQRLAGRLKAGDIIGLFGDLGTGKTTLIKGVAEGLKVNPQKVHSPTFVLMNAYKGGPRRPDLFHFDLYRLEDAGEIAGIGYDEFFYGDGVAVIEWADRLGTLLPDERLDVTLTHKSPSERTLRLAARGPRYETLITEVNKDEPACR